MANRYGEAALLAARQGMHSPNATPLDRWNTAVRQLYPTSPTQQKKGSPRGTFLGLCEAGLIEGIPSGSYGSTGNNKEYAVRAVAHLQNGTAERNVNALWRQVTEDEEKEHTSQMDVVLALWKNGLIVSA